MKVLGAKTLSDGETIADKIQAATEAQKYAKSTSKKPERSLTRAYAKAWLSLHALSDDMLPDVPPVAAAEAPESKLDKSLVATILHEGRGQLVPVPATRVPVAKTADKSDEPPLKGPSWSELNSVRVMLWCGDVFEKFARNVAWIPFYADKFACAALGMMILLLISQPRMLVKMMSYGVRSGPSYFFYVFEELSNQLAEEVFSMTPSALTKSDGIGLQACPSWDFPAASLNSSSPSSVSITYTHDWSITFMMSAVSGILGASLASLVRG